MGAAVAKGMPARGQSALRARRGECYNPSRRGRPGPHDPDPEQTHRETTMRYLGLTLAAALLTGATALAQAPAAPQPPAQPAEPAFDPERNPLDGVLLQWERAMAGIASLATNCTRVDT